METTKLLLLGLPSSGKTTFLAVIWYLVDGKLDTRLHLSELHGEREYLNSIRDKWLSCDPIDRTRRTNEQVASMKLVDIKTNNEVEIIIPDLSGETFLDQWLTRSWTREFQEIIKGATGALLFIHPGEIKEPIRIDQANLLYNEITEDKNIDSENNFPESIEWDPKEAPTQVQLIELLQFLEMCDDLNFPFKLTVVISAWDLIEETKPLPIEWLEKRMPLFYQYLCTNVEYFPFKVYGVSAQGGDYTLEEEKEKLTKIIESKERIQVIGPCENGKDLTMPLVWLMNDCDNDGE